MRHFLLFFLKLTPIARLAPSMQKATPSCALIPSSGLTQAPTPGSLAALRGAVALAVIAPRADVACFVAQIAEEPAAVWTFGSQGDLRWA